MLGCPYRGKAFKQGTVRDLVCERRWNGALTVMPPLSTSRLNLPPFAKNAFTSARICPNAKEMSKSQKEDLDFTFRGMRREAYHRRCVVISVSRNGNMRTSHKGLDEFRECSVS
jgi:hypothetical protein